MHKGIFVALAFCAAQNLTPAYSQDVEPQRSERAVTLVQEARRNRAEAQADLAAARTHGWQDSARRAQNLVAIFEGMITGHFRWDADDIEDSCNRRLPIRIPHSSLDPRYPVVRPLCDEFSSWKLNHNRRFPIMAR